MIKRFVAGICAMVSTACFAASPSSSSKLITMTANNLVVLNDEVNSRTVSAFLKTFLSLESDRRVVFISSPGGSVVEGMHLIEVVNSERAANKNLRVVCYVDEAASMAFGIVQGICDERHGSSTSTLMQHQAAFGIQGTDNQVLSRLKMIASTLRVLDAMQAKRIGITVEELKRRSADEWWTVGQEAIDANVLDKLTPAVCNKDLLSETREEKFAGFFGSGTAVFSKCPLISGPIDIKMDGRQQLTEFVRKSFEKIPLSERVIKYK